jgi:serine/threonine-protein kinase
VKRLAAVLISAGNGTHRVLPRTGLDGPSGVAVDSAGSIYVTDYGNNRVVKLAAG